MGFVRITSRPPGAAPAHIRDQWIGLTIHCEGTTDAEIANVLTGEKVTDQQGGYVINWDDAMTALGDERLEARKWWERNVMPQPLIFDQSCLVPVPD